MKLIDDLRAYHYYWLGTACYRGLLHGPDPIRAANYFTKSASLGMPSAQIMLGVMSVEGNGVPRHYREAFRWFRAAAEQNDPEGHCYLGLMYAHGLGTPQDWQNAEHHWVQAAVAGSAEAMYFLGLLHYAGIERPVSNTEAAAWFEKSAESGYAPAAHALGSMHRTGEHPSSSMEDALHWFEVAAEKDYGPSLYALGKVHEDIGEHHDPNAAASYYKKAALSGESDAMFRMGMMYLEQHDQSDGGPFSEFLALGWLKKAVEENHPGAAYVLGCLYQGGEGVFFEPDGKKLAVTCFRKAAMLGDPRAETKLKWLDQKGSETDAKDHKDLAALAPHAVRPPILKWMEISREKKALEQLFESAKRFYESEQGKKDLARAAEYFRLCSAAGSAEADYMLGCMYERGEGTTQDLAAARKHFELAANRGNPQALARIKSIDQEPKNSRELPT